MRVCPARLHWIMLTSESSPLLTGGIGFPTKSLGGLTRYSLDTCQFCFSDDHADEGEEIRGSDGCL